VTFDIDVDPYDDLAEAVEQIDAALVIVHRAVLIADDQALVRGGIRMILEAQDDVEVVGEAEDGEAAVTQTRTARPDMVLMDVRMPSLDGIAGTRRIVAEGIPTRVIVLTTFDRDEVAYDAMKAGQTASC
jgi:DNA-binding NarL/FixJ family response regulator